jgi:hypothetical protein
MPVWLKFRDDMTQTGNSANDLLQLELNTFKGYEERLHTYAENLLVDLTLVPDNLAQLTKDTSTTDSIYQAVDNNMSIYVNFLAAEVYAIVGDSVSIITNYHYIIWFLLLTNLNNLIDSNNYKTGRTSCAKDF